MLSAIEISGGTDSARPAQMVRSLAERSGTLSSNTDGRKFQ